MGYTGSGQDSIAPFVLILSPFTLMAQFGKARDEERVRRTDQWTVYGPPLFRSLFGFSHLTLVDREGVTEGIKIPIRIRHRSLSRIVV